MFPGRLSEVTVEEVKAIIEMEAAEGADFELKRELPAKRGQDPWMTGGKISDNAKDELATEIIAFANAGGGTLIVGIGEDKTTKRAIPPLTPIPKCKEAAERLHQAIGDRIEPKLPIFECAGVVTDNDGSSGVIIMRTHQSYLAPHRHTQDRHCYIRRNDRADPMSMQEIHNLMQRAVRNLEEINQAFAQSADRFYSWIPLQNQRTHPKRGIQGHHVGDNNWVGVWGLRLTAHPLAPLPIGELPRQPWLKSINPEPFNGSGQQGFLQCREIEITRQWQPRLRSVEREFSGGHLTAVDRISTEGRFDRFLMVRIPDFEKRPEYLQLSLSFLVWNVASIIRAVDIIRSENFRPAQNFALEIEFATSDKIMIIGYPGPMPSGVQLIPNESVVFPRYEIGEREGFNELLTVFDRDVWNLAGHHPNWQLSVDWPPAIVSKAAGT